MSSSGAPTTERRRLPVPRLTLVLAAVAVVLEVVGWSVRVTGAPPPVRDVLSMDHPLSIARLYVAGLFAAAAVAAAVGAGHSPGRRTWWTAVALVTAGVSVVKAGGTVHVWFLHLFGGDAHPVRGLLVSAPLALGAVGWLWWLARHERRDRRVLRCLGAYAGASVGLSFCSSVAGELGGALWGATATLVEESGEALSGVATLTAVLLGVAPRLVLPAGWPLRRTGDAAAQPEGVVTRHA